MRRIGKNAKSKLEAVAEPTPPATEKPVIPPGAPPFRCSTNIFTHADDWQAHCEKRQHSFRGCTCAPVKPPKPEPVDIQPTITFGGPA